MQAARQTKGDTQFSKTLIRPFADRDVHLMCRVREGDMHAFALLVEQHRLPVIHFLRRMVQETAIAEELTQEVFLRVYRSRLTYEPTAKFTTWLFRIATHLGINWLRDCRYEKFLDRLDAESEDGTYLQFADRHPTIEEILLAGVKAQQIRAEIDVLPRNQRAAVIMHKYQELDYSQIARTLNCTEAAVKSLLFRAYERLRLRLAHFNTSPRPEACC